MIRTRKNKGVNNREEHMTTVVFHTCFRSCRMNEYNFAHERRRCLFTLRRTADR
jgi:hypothetical protein